MKQEPILSLTPTVLEETIPSQRVMLPVQQIKNGNMLIVVSCGLAIALHAVCLLIAYWCMEGIPKQENPLHSTIEVAYEAPEALLLPQEAPALENSEDQKEPIVPEVNSNAVPALPEMEPVSPLPTAAVIIKPKAAMKVKKAHLSKPVVQNELKNITKASDSISTNHANPMKASNAQSSMTASSAQPTAGNKIRSAAQRCSAPAKDYPMAARRRHEEGSARVGYQLLADGQIAQVEIIESTGFSDLDRAAIDAVKNIRCQADLGQPVIKTIISVDFSLNKNN